MDSTDPELLVLSSGLVKNRHIGLITDALIKRIGRPQELYDFSGETSAVLRLASDRMRAWLKSRYAFGLRIKLDSLPIPFRTDAACGRMDIVYSCGPLNGDHFSFRIDGHSFTLAYADKDSVCNSRTLSVCRDLMISKWDEVKSAVETASLPKELKSAMDSIRDFMSGTDFVDLPK